MKHTSNRPRWNRRTFLKGSLAAGAALGFPTIIPSRVLGQAAPSHRLNVLQIGCGRIAESMDIPGLLRHPNLARIVAVCDVDAKRTAQAKAQVSRGYEKLGQPVQVEASGDYHDFVGRADIDAVSISTPDHWHAQPIVEAALAGKDIFVQKPLTMTVPEGRLVADVVRRKGRILQIGSQQRSGEQFHRACQLVRNGRIGRVHTVRIGLPTDPSGGNPAKMEVPPNLNYDAWLGCTPEVYYTEDRVHPQNSLKDRPGWLRLNQFTRGMITGWGTHHVDIAHWGMDAEHTGPISIEATARWPGPDSFWDVHGPYSIEMKYPGGVTMLISDKLPNGIRFEGEDGWVWVSRGEYSATASDPTAGQKGGRALEASNKEWLTCSLADDRMQLHRSPRWDHHLDWLMAVRERKDPVTNADTGHRACAACTVAWIGMRLGRPLKWNPNRERFEDDAAANALLSLPERAPYGAFAAAKKAGVEIPATL